MVKKAISLILITAEGCLIANTDTDTVIYEKNADQRLYPASLTKIMTAMVVLDECKDLENTIVTANKDTLDLLLGTDSSVFNLVADEQLPAIELLYILLVHLSSK